jgi:type IV secretory pathway component VirB8
MIPAFLGLNEYRKAIKELKKQQDDTDEVNKQSIYLFEKSKKLLILFIILFSIVSVLQIILIFL